MLPTQAHGGALVGITRDGAAGGVTPCRSIKGVEYAFFPRADRQLCRDLHRRHDAAGHLAA